MVAFEFTDGPLDGSVFAVDYIDELRVGDEVLVPVGELEPRERYQLHSYQIAEMRDDNGGVRVWDDILMPMRDAAGLQATGNFRRVSASLLVRTCVAVWRGKSDL